MTGRFAGHKWRDRLLLVFAPDDEDGKLAEQKKLLENEEPGFEERDLVPLYLLEDADARNEFGVERDAFATILVGKDGAAKARFERPVEAGEIFRRIDAMPMRKRETRGRETRRRETESE